MVVLTIAIAGKAVYYSDRTVEATSNSRVTFTDGSYVDVSGNGVVHRIGGGYLDTAPPSNTPAKFEVRGAHGAQVGDGNSMTLNF